MLEDLCHDEVILLDEFNGTMLNTHLLGEIDRICLKMCEDNFLLKLHDDVFVGNNKYFSVDVRDGKSKEVLSTCFFDCKYRGFPYVRSLYYDSIRPIVGINKEGNNDIGTVFKVGDNVYATAKHCVMDLMSFCILDKSDKPITLREIALPEDENIDIALIYTEEAVPGKSFIMMDPEILEDILVMGYPPISGMYPVLISEKGKMAATMKSTTGVNVAETKEYLRDLDCFLITARVKGGSSGSPVINKLGACCGIVVSLPNDIQNPDRIDLLGYGACLPAKYIDNMMNGVKTIKRGLKRHNGNRYSSV